MTETGSTLQAKILQLRASFVKQLPRRLAELEALIGEVAGATEYDQVAKADLFRSFHSLKGAAASFGFEELAEEAAVGEQLTQGLINMGVAVTPAKVQALGDVMAKIITQAESLSHADLTFVRPYRSAPLELNQLDIGWQNQDTPLIYICDDEAEQVEHLDYQLRCFGYRVQRFTDTDSFEAAVLTTLPDAVVMDVHFPQGDIAGTEALRRINTAHGRELPAIVLSGQDTFAGRLSAYRAGCRSYFTKPARPLELAAALDDLLKKKYSKPLRILIIDDEPDVTEYHRLILEDAGMQVEQVHDPADVFEVLQRFSPDLILIDVYMPQCTGQELAGIIRMVPEYVGMPIIYLSSETDKKKQFSAMLVGVEGFITKPVVPEELVSAVLLRAERMRTLRRLITRDSLTGLYNHSAIKDVMENVVNQARRSKDELVMAMLDLDSFKQVNDKYGHLAGDQVLLALSRVLKNRLRSGDVVGRYGGEEFAILLRKTSMQQAFNLLNTLRDDFSRIVFSSGENQFSCTISAGLSGFPQYGSIEALIGAADAAMYQAKAQGRNQVVMDTRGHD